MNIGGAEHPPIFFLQTSKTMKIKHFLILSFAFIAFATSMTSCGDKKKKSYDEIAMSGLTTRTENMKTNIKAFANKGTLIGQMYGTLTGMGWQRWNCDSDRCDIKALCGYRPAAIGYELGGIETNKQQNTDGVPFKAIKEDVLKTFNKGGLIVMNWTAPDHNGNDELLEEYTKQIANFLNGLQDGYGIKAPVVLNLLPLDGKAWYCKLSKDEYIDLYKKVQDLLDDEDVNNVVYGYSETYIPGHNLMEYYPDHNIDVVNISYLQPKNAVNLPLYQKSIKDIMAKALPFAQEHNAAFGLTTGVESIGDSSVFSEILLPELKQHHIAYLMFGRNYGEPTDEHYFTPYPGISNSKTHGFMELVNSDICIFIEKLNGLYLEH